MSAEANRRMTGGPAPEDEAAVRDLYRQLLDRWNARDAKGYAALAEPGATLIGFDGSVQHGRAQVAASLTKIFASHPTAAYVSQIREVRLLGQDAALLLAIAGMIPPGQTDINPAVNARHSLVATRRRGRWMVTLFQSTPAAFHGRPDLAEEMMAELRGLLDERRQGAGG